MAIFASACATGSDGGDEPAAAENGLLTATSAADFDTTVEQATAAIESRDPLTLVTEIDHAANAEEAGLELEPTTVLVFGNPDAGTPLMTEAPSMAIDLPQKLSVTTTDGEVVVAVNDPAYLAQRHGLDPDAEPLDAIREVLDEILAEATA